MFCPLLVPSAAAGFSTNFNTSGMYGDFYSYWNGACSFGDGCDAHYMGNNDPTAFAEKAELINGQWYLHAIVGDPATGFAQESYVRVTGNAASVLGGCTSIASCEMQNGFSPDGAGMDRAVTTPNSTDTNVADKPFITSVSNSANPLDSVHMSGTGGLDPTKSVFHMMLVSPDGDMALDVNKPFLDRKPIITQTVQDGDMTSTFVADMTKLTYSDMNTPIKIVNDTTFNDPTIPGNGAANFDMANAQQSDVTAGRYTFTKPAGYGWNYPNQGWDYPQSYFTLGIYSYYGATTGYDVYNTDWTRFFDYDQNALACLRGGGGLQRQTEGKTSYPGYAGTKAGSGGPAGVGSCPGH